MPKMFRFQLSNAKFFSANSQPMLNLSTSSFATLSPLLSSNVSSYVVNDSSAFEARRAAILTLPPSPRVVQARLLAVCSSSLSYHGRRPGSLRFSLPFVIARAVPLRVLNQACLVIDLVNRNLYSSPRCVRLFHQDNNEKIYKAGN